MPAIGRIIPYLRASARPARLALDLSPDAVRLMGRTALGSWIEIGSAPLDHSGFAARIDALRVEALVRGPGPVPVDLWLPAEQVLVRRLALPVGPGRRASALRRISAETGQAAGALAIAVADAPPREPATVLAVLSQTVDEARDYARRWGFRPGRVSTRVEAKRFGAAGPCFRRVRMPALRAGALAAATAAVAAPAAAALALALALGAGSLELWDAPSQGQAARDPGTAPPLQVARIDAGAPTLSRGSFTQISRHGIQALPARQSPGQAAGGAAVAPAGQGAPPAFGMAPDLSEPGAGARMRVGSSPALPSHIRPGRLQRVAAGIDGTDISAVRHAVGRIRDQSRARAVVPAPVTAAVGQRLVVPVAASPSGPVILAASLAPILPVSAAPAMLSGDPLPAPEPEIRLAADGTAAPETVPVLPAPRPKTEAVSEPAEAAPEDEAEPASDSPVASVEAPRPPAKPGGKAREARAAAVQETFGGKPSPGTVRNLASQSGLDLDDTNLIGVLDARSGRQALLRMSGGEYLKVGRGDAIDGWRVSAINRDAVRLTRGGRSRTLLLVAP